MNTLNGKWAILKASQEGKDITGFFADEKLEIGEDQYKLWSREKLSDAGLLRFYNGSNALDICGLVGPNAGKIFLCIHQLEGDQLIICYNLVQNGIRPGKLEATSSNNFILITYQKAK